jgi:hypothetical protein
VKGDNMFAVHEKFENRITEKECDLTDDPILVTVILLSETTAREKYTRITLAPMKTSSMK